jgi:hypothetical protein
MIIDYRIYQYLKALKPLKEVQDRATLFEVATILDSEGEFGEPDDVIRFIEKPYKMQSRIDQMVKSYERDSVAEAKR